MRGPRSYPGISGPQYRGRYDHDCPCCGGVYGRRRYPSSQEKREILEDYKDELKKELQGVEEELKKLVEG